MPEEDRWRLYRRWAYDARENCYEVISDFQEIFDSKANELQDLRNQEDLQILREKDVIGMTTTGNCSTELRQFRTLQKLTARSDWRRCAQGQFTLIARQVKVRVNLGTVQYLWPGVGRRGIIAPSHRFSMCNQIKVAYNGLPYFSVRFL